MARLIDADALVHAIANTPSEVAKVHSYNVLSSLADRQNEILSLIEKADEVDAVEVVRCGECRHCFTFLTKRNKQRMWLCMRNEYEASVRPEDFCSCGERKEEVTAPE